MGKIDGKKILMIIASKLFRDEEYSVPRETFEKEGARVTVASDSSEMAEGKLGLKVEPDILIEDVSSDEYDAAVFVGGPGSKNFWNNKTAHRIAKSFSEQNKLVCAICSAPIILSNAGLLRGKRATCFKDDRSELEKGGAIYTGKSVEVDANFVTGSGPSAAAEFAKTIISRLIN